MAHGQRAFTKAAELRQLSQKIVGQRRVARATQCQRRQRIGARSAADAEIDAPRVQRLEQPIRFGHLQRGMIGQHHAAGTEAQPRRQRANVRDHDLRRRRGDARHVVVLRVPQPLEAQALDRPRQVLGATQRRGAATAARKRHEIEGGQRQGTSARHSLASCMVPQPSERQSRRHNLQQSRHNHE